MSDYRRYLISFPWKSIVFYATSSAAVYGLWKALKRIFIAPYFSPLRDLPGPPSTNIFYGNLGDIFRAGPAELHAEWVETYGPTLVYKGLLQADRLMTLDPKGLSHILNHSYDWQKPEEVRINLAQILGEGVLFAEGDSHRRQRRIMNPSFSQSHIRELTVIFHEKSQKLRDALLGQVAENGGSYSTNVMTWLGRATLDIIGLAGFNYAFNALDPDGKENELLTAFTTILKQSQRVSLFVILMGFLPILRLIPTARKRNFAAASKVMSRIGQKLVDDKKKDILASVAAEGKQGAGEAHIEKSSIKTRDLLSRLMAANMATDLTENQRLSDEDVFAQIPTFLVAGHETTSTATTWCLYALCMNPAVQTKLREELLSVGTDTPSMDELNSLPYLDAVIRETLRLHAPVTASTRIAMRDDVVPLGTPYKDRKGRLQHEIRVKKGAGVFIPILLLNTYKPIWGEDALEFRPERWQEETEKAADIPGVFAGLLSFLGGPRSCIGYRFALIEFKCLVFALVRTFQFELAIPASEIVAKSNIVTRPFVKTALQDGAQLPLRITPWKGT